MSIILRSDVDLVHFHLKYRFTQEKMQSKFMLIPYTSSGGLLLAGCSKLLDQYCMYLLVLVIKEEEKEDTQAKSLRVNFT